MGIYCTSKEDHIATCIEDEIDVYDEGVASGYRAGVEETLDWLLEHKRITSHSHDAVVRALLDNENYGTQEEAA